MAEIRSSSLLKDVVAFVDVWSTSRRENYSDVFMQQLSEMGAEVSKTFNKTVTHVIFKQGHQSTWDKAKRMGVKLVSVHWVDRCRHEGQHADEDLFPAMNEESTSVLGQKKHRCMQPRDKPVRTPENDKRLRKKLDKMIESLTPLSPIVVDRSPLFIDEENGIIYSPSFKVAESMAQRLKDMRDKRENLSPTASQMLDSTFSHGQVQPSSPKSTPSRRSFMQLLEEAGDDDRKSPCLPKATSTGTSKEKVHSMNSGQSHTSGLLVAPQSKEKKHNRKTGKLATSSPLPGNLCETQSSQETVSCGAFDTKAPCPLKQRGRSKASLTQSSMKQNSLDSYFLATRPKERESIAVAEATLGDGLSYSATHAGEGDLEMTPQKDQAQKMDSHRETSPIFSDSRTRGNKPGVWTEKKQASAISLLPGSRKHECKTNGPSNVTLTPKKSSVKNTPSSKTGKGSASCLRSRNAPEEDDVFEDYFSSAEKPKMWKKFTIQLTPEKDLDSPFKPSTKPVKRKRGRSESEETSHTSSKQKVAHVSTAEFLRECSGLNSSPGHISSLKSRSLQPNLSAFDLPTSKDDHDSERRGHKPVDVTRDKKEIVPTKDSVPPSPADMRLAKLTLNDPLTSGESQSKGFGFASESLRERSTEMFSCQGGKKDKNVKLKRTLVMTSMPTEKQHTVLQVVDALGGFSVVDSVCESTTHVVAGSPRRTLNVLLGIARGCWILSYEWILWCLEQGQWIPEEPYELSDSFPAAPICRLQQHLSAGEHQQDLFQGLPCVYVSPMAQPPAPTLEELVRLCGGVVSRTVRQAGLLIGQYKGRRPQGTRCVSEQWILDCVTHLKRLPYEDYDLEDQGPRSKGLSV